MSADLENAIKPILSIARFAPSVHNTQPWKVRVDDDMLAISLDPDHVLSDGDPTGRETIISLGIFAEAIRIGAEARGFKAASIKLIDRSAVVHLKPYPPKADSSELVNLLRKRCSDRSIYRPIDVGEATVKTIVDTWQDQETHIHVLADKAEISQIADLTSKGIGVAMSNPRFRKELSHYLVLPWSTKKRGISVRSLHIPTLVAICQPFFVRMGVGLGAEARLEKRRWQSASGVVAITTARDMLEDWFEAGRAYLCASLAIEKLGFAQATSAATVEASNYHEDIETMLGTQERLQCMIRIGRGSKHKEFSPRVSAETLLST